MTNYNELSDFEINKRVATVLEKFVQKPIFENQMQVHILVGYYEVKIFDPCNNPTYAWPIIEANQIDIQFRQGANIPPMARHDNYYQVDKNPLRAAMVVFLMMNEKEGVL